MHIADSPRKPKRRGLFENPPRTSGSAPSWAMVV